MPGDENQAPRFRQGTAAWLGGCAVVGLLLAGGGGLFIAGNWASQPEAGAIGLVAAALAFGLLMNAIYRR